MPSLNTISSDKLVRLVALPGSPTLVDIRPAPKQAVPGSIFRSFDKPDDWSAIKAASVVVIDEAGDGRAVAAASILRSEGVAADALDGGFASWLAAGFSTVSLDHLPPRHSDGRTWWVTRARPKVDRIACPWLIRRFIDPEARFLFVAPGEVVTIATQQQAEPFDVSDEGVLWSHRGERCTFDVMLEAFGLSANDALVRVASIVRGADTDRLDIAPEAAGLLAISLGLSRIHDDDHAQLEAGMAVYDALYRWSRDAQGEKHNWTSHQPARGKVSE